jgi:hypothetical protein
MADCENCGRDAVGRFCPICARALRDAAQPAEAREAGRRMTEEERRMVAHAITQNANDLNDESDEIARQAVAHNADREDAARTSRRLADRAYALRELANRIFTGEVG